MFNFFKSSKKSPIPSPTESLKADDSTQRASDDFVLLGNGGNNPTPLYPSAQLPAPPAPSPHHGSFNRQYSLQVANYTQNVPFKLNPLLCSTTGDDFFEYKLREITNHLTQVANTRDYDFKLERSIVEQN